MTFWDAAAPLYDVFELFNKPYRLMVSKICELTPLGANVLELAGGTGSISIAVSGKAGRVLCSDISGSMLKTANRKAKKRGVVGIGFEKLSISETHKQDGAFDVVIASQILHLLDEPQKACDEIRRITKNMAIINMPLLKEVTTWGAFLIGLYKLFGFRPKHELDRNSCKKLLEELGFNGCEYYVIEGTVSLCLAVWRRE